MMMNNSPELSASSYIPSPSPSLTGISSSTSTTTIVESILVNNNNNNNASTTTMGIEIATSSSTNSMLDPTSASHLVGGVSGSLIGCKQSLISSPSALDNINNNNNNSTPLSSPLHISLPPPPPPPPMMTSSNLSIHKRKLININHNRAASSSSASSSSSSSTTVMVGATMDQLLSGFNRNNLTKTKTKVRTADGRIYEEQVSLQTCEFKGMDESTITKKYNTISNLPPSIYCNHRCQWIEYKYHQHQPQSPSQNSNNTINILTNNVWFDSFLWRERAQGLFEEISSLLPDVVCLQEVTPMFLDLLKEQSWVKNNYILSDSGHSDTVFPYGIIIMTKYHQHSRYRLISYTLYPLPSSQNRRMIMSTLMDTHSNKTIVISSVHLESLQRNGQDRIKQLDYISNTFKSLVSPSPAQPSPAQSSFSIQSILNITPPSSPIKQQVQSSPIRSIITEPSPMSPSSIFLVGDFNFGESTEEDKKLIEKGFMDLWKCSNNNSSNNKDNNNNNNQQQHCEIDQSTNGITCIKKNERVDRLVYWNQDQESNNIGIKCIKMIGTKIIEIEEEKRRIEKIDRDELIYPSDHFGLYCQITMNCFCCGNHC